MAMTCSSVSRSPAVLPQTHLIPTSSPRAGTNVLGHAHFTLSLIPELIEGAKSSSDGKARVVNTSSDSAYLGTPKDGIDWNALRDGPPRKKMGSMTLYAQSKFVRLPSSLRPRFAPDLVCYRQANVVFSNELARRYAAQGIISNSLNPGTSLSFSITAPHMSNHRPTIPGHLKTDLQRHMSAAQRTVLVSSSCYACHCALSLNLPPIMTTQGAFLYPASLGALTQLYVGTSPQTANNSGDFFVPWARLGKLTGPSADPAMGRRLWDWIEEQREGH